MMPTILRRGALAVVPACILAACNDSPVDPNDDPNEAQINADVAAVMAQTTGDDVSVMTDEGDDTMRPGFGNACNRRGGLRFTCGTRQFGDLTISREVTFFGDGTAQEIYDAQATDSINIVTSIAGSRAREGVTHEVAQDRDFTVSGLGGDETERIWNGTGSAAVNRTRHSDEHGDRTYDLTSSSTVTDVVIAVPREGTWPLSGTITRQVTVEIVAGVDATTATRERNVVVTFNGTQFVPMTVNGHEFTLDLATRRIVDETT